ncbi:MAG: hypothetical protein WDZ73_01220 [Candidatus Paceibacterota bacterium]
MAQPTQLVFEGIDGTLRVSPPLFAKNKTGVDPADLNQFAPHGNGVYGYQEGMTNPFKTAPPQDDIGGLLHFGNRVSREDFNSLMSITGVCPQWVKKNGRECRDYAVFYQESENPSRDGYLAQMRIVSKFALRYMFDFITEAEYAAFDDQELSKSDALWSFMENERSKYGTHFGSAKLDGKFGGDGDFAQEELCFGFMVENNYYRVYRIWSRAWLVTK